MREENRRWKMAVKPDALDWSIKEQIIEDPVSGLTFQFVAMPGSDAPFRLRLYGDLPYGNREILFDETGAEAGAGTALQGACPPSWIRRVS
jgi:hypothetical protein